MTTIDTRQLLKTIPANMQRRNDHVLMLYLQSNDKRIRVIGDICGISPDCATQIISGYFAGKIIFGCNSDEIYHSRMNSKDWWV